MRDLMKAMAITKVGPHIIEVPKPIPRKGEVRVKVYASAVNPAEEKVISGDFVGRFLHAKISPLIVGWDFAGVVDAIGDDINDLETGTAVWGHLEFTFSQKQGAFSEYIIVSREEIAVKPERVSFGVAAAAATIGMTSLQALRDSGNLREGEKVLIIGAAGGIGSISVGISKRLGAHVTAVCSTKDVDIVKSLGADLVIDRKNINPLKTDSKFKVVFDTPAVHSFSRCSNILNHDGAYVTTLPDLALIAGMIRSLFNSQRCRFVQVSSRRNDLELLGSWLNDGLEVPIDSHHSIKNLDDALKRQNSKSRNGRVVVDVDGGWF